MSQTMRIGVAGAARGAGFVAGARALGGDATLTAIYDPNQRAREGFADSYQVETQARSFAELLECVDLVILSSPQQHHAPQAVEALHAGVHVLSEVPAAVSMPQSDALLAAARRSSAYYAMAENYCYIRSNLVVREMVRAGLFGDLYHGEGEYLHDVRSLLKTKDGAPTWRSTWQTGRDGNTYPTHSLGPLLQWFDDRIVAVSCVGTGRHTAPEHAIQDSITLLGRTARGALIRTRLDLLSNRPHLMDFYAIQGTGGAYESARLPGAEPSVYLNGKSPENTWESLDRYTEKFLPDRYRTADASSAGHWGADSWPIQDFVRQIRAGDEPEIDIYRALDMTLPGLVSEASIAQQGTWLPVPDPRLLTAGIGSEPGSAVT